MLLATPFWSRTIFPHMPHLYTPTQSALWGCKSTLLAEEWDYRLLHCNRLISTRPAFHPIYFHLHPYCVSCPSYINRFVQERLILLFIVKEKKKRRKKNINVLLRTDMWKCLCSFFFWASIIYIQCVEAYVCVSVGNQAGCEIGIDVSIWRQVFRCDWGVQRRHSASVCCLRRGASTTGLDYLLLLECEIWICFFITQTLAWVRARRRSGKMLGFTMHSWAEFVLSVAYCPRFWTIALFLRRDITKNINFSVCCIKIFVHNSSILLLRAVWRQSHLSVIGSTSAILLKQWQNNSASLLLASDF